MNRRQLIAAMLGSLALAACGKKQQAVVANPTEVKEFWDAMNDGDATIIDRLLKAKPYLANAKNEAGQTPLAFAKGKGDDELTDVVRKAGGKD